MKKNFIKFICFNVLMFLCFSVFVLPVFAQSFDNPVAGLEKENVQSLAGKLIQNVLGLIGIVALILILYAGFLWMTSQGQSEKIKKAKDIMIYAVIGIFVVFAAYSILKFVFGII